MTHDPREALEPCPFCGARPFIGEGGEPEHATIACNNDACIVDTCCVSSTKDEAVKRWNTRALTASPGEQKPVAWRMRLVAGVSAPLGWEYLSNQPSKHPRYEVEPLYLSPPPAAGWNEAIEAAKLVVERWSLPTIQTPSMWLIDKAGIVAEIESLRREAPAPEGVSTQPAAAESNASVEQTITEEPDGSILIDAYAGWSREQLKDRCRELLSLASVEARLREALERVRSILKVPYYQDCAPLMARRAYNVVEEALAAVGDEANESRRSALAQSEEEK